VKQSWGVGVLLMCTSYSVNVRPFDWGLRRLHLADMTQLTGWDERQWKHLRNEMNCVSSQSRGSKCVQSVTFDIVPRLSFNPTTTTTAAAYCSLVSSSPSLLSQHMTHSQWSGLFSQHTWSRFATGRTPRLLGPLPKPIMSVGVVKVWAVLDGQEPHGFDS